MRDLNHEGKPRRIGIELEFHGLSPLEAAKVVQGILGGDIHKETDHCVRLDGPLGKFRLETDLVYLKKLALEMEDAEHGESTGILKSIVESLSAGFVPTELVSPPLPLNALPTLTKIHRALARAGAQGSIESVRFAFGAQLNPELRSHDAKSILNHLRAFLILTPWLKDQIQVDLSRRLTFFASDFPVRYQEKVLDASYAPDRDQLIADYLEYNPSRNRALDLLPLFAFLDEKTVRSGMRNQKLNPRPTFHYRLPNCQLSRPSWSIEVEWQRWLLVEKLAQNTPLLKEMAESTLDGLTGKIGHSEWMMDLNNWVEGLRQ